MDVFMEKIVKKKKDIKDHLLTVVIIIAALILMFLALNFVPPQLSLFFIVGIGYISYMLITNRNIEYEYAVTNGDLDIDKIIAQRKRKRVFSENCKNFDIVAKVKSHHYTPQYRNFKNQMNYASSLDSDDVYFIALQYNNEQTIVYFEPSEKMLQSFRTYIPRKVFID
ncbi:MAG: hypothetical protein GX211_09400 [Clostridiaceae bacterium]|nr:hypothetical protein [Clostridiaceae bacterium]